MAQYGNYGYYQTLQEEDALEIALRESKEMYQIDKEATDLALALELSLIEDKQDIIDRCSESDSCSEAGIVQWDPDTGRESDVINDRIDCSTWEEPEKTFIRESEVKETSNKDFHVSLIDEDSSDGEQEAKAEVTRKTGKSRNLEEFLKMSIPLSQSTEETSYSSTSGKLAHDKLDVISDKKVCGLQAATTPEQLPVTESVDLLSNTLVIKPSFDTPVAPLSFEDSDYTLKNDIVTIPGLGSFRQKIGFSAIAMRQLIEKMLSESIIHGDLLTSAAPETESHCPLEPSQTVKSSDISTPGNVETSNYHNQIPSLDVRTVPSPSISLQQKETMPCRRKLEEIRRGQFYNSLVRAQYHYAEKITIPSSSTYRFTKDEWDTLGEDLKIEDWEGGFLIETPYKKSRQSELKKENLPSWKGKEKAVEIDSDDEDAATLMMVF